MKTKLLIPVLLLIGFAGCISIKSDYPDIKYYRLKQLPSNFKNVGPISGVLQIRNFSISEELDNDQLIALWDNARLQKYYYHRWLSGAAGMATDFFITRFNQLGIFKDGTVKSNTILTPEFIMEAQILDMVARNSTEEAGKKNSAIVTMQINIIQRIPLQIEKKIIVSKVYTATAERPNTEAVTIPDAISQCFSEISDKLLSDIYASVPQYSEPEK
jgi:ABC-type uncharacterized transport system auxiliary subunit